MNTEEMGPATTPYEATRALYREAMVAWLNGDLEGFANFLDLASKCALIGIASTQERTNR